MLPNHFGLSTKKKPKFWWFLYTYIICIINLAARIFVIGTNFGYFFLHSDHQLKGIQGRNPVLLNKFFWLIWGSAGNYRRNILCEQLFLNPQYWVLHLAGRAVRRRTNSTCVRLYFPYTWIPFFERLCVCMSTESYRVDILVTLNEAIIPPEFNSIFLVSDCVTFRI